MSYSASFSSQCRTLNDCGVLTEENVRKILEKEGTDKLIHSACNISSEKVRRLLIDFIASNAIEHKEEIIVASKPNGFFQTAVAQRTSNAMRQETPKWDIVKPRGSWENKKVAFVSSKLPISVWKLTGVPSGDKDVMGDPPENPPPGHIFRGWQEFENGWQAPKLLAREQALPFPFRFRVGKESLEAIRKTPSGDWEPINFKQMQKELRKYAIESKKILVERKARNRNLHYRK